MAICELCTENVNVHIVSKCNHNNICFLCIIKLRVKTGNEKCPFCNLHLTEIVLTDKPEVNYEDLDLNSVIAYSNGLYFENEKVKSEVDEFNQIKCTIPKCQDTSIYHNINNLKKHLKERHNRFFCDICLDHRTLVLKEQRMFTGAQLDRHMKKGDLDDEGNVIFFHPYCKFCDKFFYDEEALIKHLREAHYKCDLCDQDRKFFFYHRYETLEVHYNLSHYLCQDEICRKSHTVFRTAAELEHHSMKMHVDKSQVSSKQLKNVNQNLVMSMTNFNYGNASEYTNRQQQSRSGIKDREGVDFEPQILSQRKFHTKFHTESEVSGDERLDIRRYFPKNQIKELYISQSENYAKEFKDVEFVNEDDNRGGNDGGSYRGYKSRRGGYGGRGRGGHHYEPQEKQMYVPKNLGTEQELYLENCNMVNYIHLAISKDELMHELGKVLSETERKELQHKITDYYRGRISEGVFFDSWVQIVTKRLTFKVFPFFIATCENEDTCKKLDDHFYLKMLQLPRKNNALIYDFTTYNHFFNSLYTEIEKYIINNIKAKKIDYKAGHFTMDPPRIFQLIQIIKRLSNADMATFKFAINFGLNPKTKEVITDILLQDKNQIQQKLDLIPEQEIFILYKYLDLCKLKLSKKLDTINFRRVSKNLLEDIFTTYPDVATLFEKQLGKEEFKDLTEKKYVDMETKLNIQHMQRQQSFPKPAQTVEKQPIEEQKDEPLRAGAWKQEKDFDAKNKFEFPDLKKNNKMPETIPIPAKQKSKIIGANGAGWEKKNNPYTYSGKDKAKEVEIKKKVEDDFPTLAKEASLGEQASYWNKLNKPIKKTSTEPTPGEWEGQAYDDYYEQEDNTLGGMIVGVTEKKGKKAKAKKTVYLSGGFK